MLPLEERGFSKRDRRRRTEELLAECGLTYAARWEPTHCQNVYHAFEVIDRGYVIDDGRLHFAGFCEGFGPNSEDLVHWHDRYKPVAD
jgi:hypothetical protein